MVDHPNRYPKHPDPNKGQVYGGECNRTACHAQGAVYWNRYTFGLYCTEDARAINRGGIGDPTCILLQDKPSTIDEMNQLARSLP